MVNPIRFILQMIRRSWWIAAVCVLVAANLALLSAHSATPIYQVNATFVVSATETLDDNRDVFDSIGALDDRNRSVVATYAEILSSRSIFRSAADALELTSDQRSAYEVTVVVLPSANILNIMITGPDPEIAVSLATLVSRQGVEFIQRIYEIHDVIQLDQATLPTEPISPRPLRDAVLAGFLGGILGGFLMLLREQIIYSGGLFGAAPAQRSEDMPVLSSEASEPV